MSSSSQLVPSTPDVLVRNEGTVFLFCPLTSRGKQWIEEHVQPDALWFGSALVVEHRCAWGLMRDWCWHDHGQRERRDDNETRGLVCESQHCEPWGTVNEGVFMPTAPLSQMGIR